MSNINWKERIKRNYCNYRAFQELIDKAHKCSKDCLATELITFISKLLKEEREKMAEALMMERDRAVYGALTKYDSGYQDGYNQVVDEFNKTIDNYLKEEKL